MKILIAGVLIVVSTTTVCLAETFFWEDKKGIHTTDDISKLPPKFRDKYEKFIKQNPKKESIAATAKASINKESAIETLRGYLQAENWRDRFQYVLNEDRVRPFMERYYASNKLWTPPEFSIATINEPIVSKTGWVKVDVNFKWTIITYYVKKTNSGYKIDWEATTGFNQTTVEEFKATRPTLPVRMRLYGQLSDYYNFEFRNAKNAAWSIRLIDDKHPIFGNGYISKDTDEGARIFAMLKDGLLHKIVVEASYLPNAQDTGVFLISRLVALDTWWVDDEE